MSRCLNVFYILVTICTYLSGQEDPPLYVGWNHRWDIGLDLTSMIRVNPRIGEEGSGIRWGGTLELENIYVDLPIEFRHRFLLQLSGFRNQTDAFVDTLSGQITNPMRKNYDRLEWQFLFSKEITPEKDFITAEQHFISQMTSGYEGNYFRQALPELRKISGFLSPLTSTTSVGLERRKADIYRIYFAPMALKGIWVREDRIAAIPALNQNRDGFEFFGSGIHGNDLTLDTARLVASSFQNTKWFLGPQLLFNYRQELVPDKLEVVNETRLFFDFFHPPLHLDIRLTLQINYRILKGLQFGFMADLLRDQNLVFQSFDPNLSNQIARSTFTRGVSYMHRLLIRYTFER